MKKEQRARSQILPRGLAYLTAPGDKEADDVLLRCSLPFQVPDARWDARTAILSQVAHNGRRSASTAVPSSTH